MTKRITPPVWYACQCGRKHTEAAFHCPCGFQRDPCKRLSLDDRDRIKAAWKHGRTVEWISAKFVCSNRMARQYKPASMKKRTLKVM